MISPQEFTVTGQGIEDSGSLVRELVTDGAVLSEGVVDLGLSNGIGKHLLGGYYNGLSIPVS